MSDEDPGRTRLDARQPDDKRSTLMLREIEVSHQLGEGGMGVVAARLQSLERRSVAVKRAHPGVSADILLAEAQTMARLEHPAIPTLFRVEQASDGTPSIVMQRIHGHDWTEHLARSRPIDRIQELDRFLQICAAVRHAHTRGIVHRDIKPDNVMISHDGDAFLLDWGLAIDPENHQPGAGPSGTPYYLAPEMLGTSSTDEHIDSRTDIYLLGGVLHEIFLGRPPHARREDNAGISVHVILARAALDELQIDDADISLAAILKRCLATSKAARFQTVEALEQAISDYQNTLRYGDRLPVLQTRLESKAMLTESMLTATREELAWLAERLPANVLAQLHAAQSSAVDRAVQHAEKNNAPELALRLATNHGRTLSVARMSALKAAADTAQAIRSQHTRWLDGKNGRIVMLLGLWVIFPIFWLLPLRDAWLNQAVYARDTLTADLTATIVFGVMWAVVNRFDVKGRIRMIFPVLFAAFAATASLAYLVPHGSRTIDFPVWALCFSALAVVWRRSLWIAALGYALGAFSGEIRVSPNLVQAAGVFLSWCVFIYCAYVPMNRHAQRGPKR